ncbi:MAG: SPOR domain-containing protein [Gammaproteobacteria bacterium]|nr:SPOR domain-containing protein [Gammaproteobacteria bacterium]
MSKGMDEGDDLLADFNDLFPDDSDDNDDTANEEEIDNTDLLAPVKAREAERKEIDDGDVELEELDALLDDFDDTIDNTPAEAAPSQEANTTANQDDIDKLFNDNDSYAGQDDSDGMLELDDFIDETPGITTDRGREPDLDDTDLDLSFGANSDDLEPPPPPPPSPPPKAAAKPVAAAAAVAPEPAMAAAATAAAATAATTGRESKSDGDDLKSRANARRDRGRSAVEDEPQAAGGNKKSKLAIAALTLALLALAGGGYSVWTQLQYQTLAADFTNRLELIELRLAEMDSNSGQGAISLLNQRIDSLSNNGGELSKQNQQEIANINTQLKKLEDLIAKLPAQIAKSTNKAAAAQTEMAAVSEAVVATKPVKSEAVADTSNKPTADESSASKSWSINLFSFSSQAAANSAIQRLRRAGVQGAAIKKSSNNGRLWYRVRIGGFRSKGDADAYIRTIPRSAEIVGAWVTNE